MCEVAREDAVHRVRHAVPLPMVGGAVQPRSQRKAVGGVVEHGQRKPVDAAMAKRTWLAIIMAKMDTDRGPPTSCMRIISDMGMGDPGK